MIIPPRSWRRHGGVHVLTLTPPRGQARIRYHERLPLRPFAEIVDGLLADEPWFRVCDAGAPSRLLTEEGEHAAWIAVRGVDASGPARRWIGAVLTDEFVAALDGLSRQPDLDEEVARTTRWLLGHASFRLGARRRRFGYRAPAAWQGVPSGLATTWYPPDFPRRRTMLVVFPAEPSRDDAQTLFEQILADEEERGLVRAGTVERRRLEPSAGLAGRVFSYHGRWPSDDAPTSCSVAVLSDGAYGYVLRLESAPAAHEPEALIAVARTARPVPRPGGVPPDRPRLAADVAGPWTE